MLISVKASHAGTGSESELQLCPVVIRLHYCDSWGFLGVKCLQCFFNLTFYAIW